MEQESISSQEVFDQVYTHLLTQNEKSTNEAGSCMYRGPFGRSCAIGCLIKDEEYHPCMDCLEAVPSGPSRGVLLTSSAVNRIKSVGLLPARLDTHMELLSYLQTIHDAIDVADWKNRLEQVASQYHLSIPE